MEFKKYNEIENSYREKFINEIIQQGKSGGEWIVTEKVHGTNFGIWYDGTEFKAAKRTGFLGDNAKFYNFQYVYKQNQPKIKKIWDWFKENWDYPEELETLTVYGEMFGGTYPHPDVKKMGSGIIQKGVFYTPDNLFYTFDIRVNNYAVNKEIFADAAVIGDMLYAIPLFTGTFQECLKYGNAFKSTIPKLLGLPEIESENICEGIVIEPVEPAFLGNGSRVILKSKNEKFTEKSKGKKEPKEEIKLSENGTRIWEIMESLITENRLNNVLSKEEGPITNKHFGMLLGKLNKDVLEEFNKDHEEEFDGLEGGEQKKIRSNLNRFSGNVIRKDFLNIIDRHSETAA